MSDRSAPLDPAAVRARLGLGPREMAAKMLMPDAEWDALESGRTRPARAERMMLDWLVVDAERRAALATSGLPTCAWMERHERAAPPPGTPFEVVGTWEEKGEEHVESCPACQARERWAEERVPGPPAALTALGRLHTWGAKRPAWMQPALIAAAIFGSVAAVNAVVTLVTHWREPRVVLGAFTAILLAAAAGGFAGLAYRVLARPLLRIPVAGRYLAAFVVLATYVFAAMVLLSVVDGRKFSGTFYLVLLGISSVVGVPIWGAQMPRPHEVDA